MKNQNVLIEMLKLFGLVILGWILWIFIFAITITPESADMAIELFPGSAFLFGLITAMIISFVIKFNQVHKMYQNIKGKLSNIRVVIERGERLLEKANKVVDKYMNYEQNVLIEVTKERTGNKSSVKKVLNSTQFQNEIENYPELQANQNVMKLLDQIRECEVTIANFKIGYNEEVASYNTIIHSFPVILFRKIAGFQDVEFYQGSETGDTDEITDEMLGI